VADDQAQVGDGQRGKGGVVAEGTVGVVHDALAAPVGQPGDVGKAAAALQGVNQLDDRGVAFAAHDEIGVGDSLIGQEGDVRPAEHHPHPRLAQPVGHLVGRGRGRGGRGEADQVCREQVVPIDRGEGLDIDAHVVTALGQDRADLGQAEPGQQRVIIYVVTV